MSQGPEREMQIGRREAIRRGFAGTAGAVLAGSLGAPAAAAPKAAGAKTPTQVKAKSIIQIFLWGGMSHNDTWDPKPESGREYMGEFGQVVDTNVEWDSARCSVPRTGQAG